LNTKFITNTNDAMVVNDMRDAEIEYFKLSSASASASASAPAPAPAPPPPPVKIAFDRDYQFDDDIITQDGLNFRFEKTRGLLFLMPHDVTFGEADKKTDVITDVDGYASYFHNISNDRLTRYLAKFNKILCDIDHWKFHNLTIREGVYRHKQKDLTYSILGTLKGKLEGEKNKYIEHMKLSKKLKPKKEDLGTKKEELYTKLNQSFEKLESIVPNKQKIRILKWKK